MAQISLKYIDVCHNVVHYEVLANPKKLHQ
jgi:hypothetical protein